MTGAISVSELLQRPPIRLAYPSPDTRRLEQAAAAVNRSLRHVTPKEPPDIETRIRDFEYWRRDGMRREIRLLDALLVAGAVFRGERRELGALDDLRDFFIRQTGRCAQLPFSNAMMVAHLEGWRGPQEPGAEQTQALARALDLALQRRVLTGDWAACVVRLPELIDPFRAPELIARRIAMQPDPDRFLRDMGLPDPQGAGLMHAADRAYQDLLADRLARRDEDAQRAMLAWLKPEGYPVRETGASRAISALLEPFHNAPVNTTIRDSLATAYGDPRFRDSAIWRGVSADARKVMLRWLTERSFQTFINVITQEYERGSDRVAREMWRKRRRVWEDWFRKGRIVDACVALSPGAMRIARGMEQTGVAAGKLDYGKQTAGGTRSTTSLLIVRIGSAVYVEGSHSYKTHCFPDLLGNVPDMHAPEYNCESLRRRLRNDWSLCKSHSEFAWPEWLQNCIWTYP